MLKFPHPNISDLHVHSLCNTVLLIIQLSIKCTNAILYYAIYCHSSQQTMRDF